MKNEVTHKMGVSIFRPSGKIIGRESQAFKETIVESFKELSKNSTPPKLLFDFHDVTRMDSTSLGVLMEIGIRAKRQAGRVGVINVGTHIKSLLIVSHIISHFEHFNSENDAILALRD